MPTMRWFGHKYDAPAWEDMPDQPVIVIGQNCIQCGQELGPDDDGVTVPNGSTGKPVPFHLRCFLDNLGLRGTPRRIG